MTESRIAKMLKEKLEIDELDYEQASKLIKVPAKRLQNIAECKASVLGIYGQKIKNYLKIQPKHYKSLLIEHNKLVR